MTEQKQSVLIDGTPAAPEDPEVTTAFFDLDGFPKAAITIRSRVGSVSLYITDPVACDILEDALGQVRAWLAEPPNGARYSVVSPASLRAPSEEGAA